MEKITKATATKVDMDTRMVRQLRSKTAIVSCLVPKKAQTPFLDSLVASQTWLCKRLACLKNSATLYLVAARISSLPKVAPMVGPKRLHTSKAASNPPKVALTVAPKKPHTSKVTSNRPKVALTVVLKRLHTSKKLEDTRAVVIMTTSRAPTVVTPIKLNQLMAARAKLTVNQVTTETKDSLAAEEIPTVNLKIPWEVTTDVARSSKNPTVAVETHTAVLVGKRRLVMVAARRENPVAAREENMVAARREDMEVAREENMAAVKREDMEAARKENMAAVRKEATEAGREEGMVAVKKEVMEGVNRT